MLRVGDEVTNALIKESGCTVFENGKVSFVYEIAEGIFVLSTH